LLSGLWFLRRFAAANVHAGAITCRTKLDRDPRARAAHENPRLQHLATYIRRLHHRRWIRRTRRRALGAYRWHRKSGERRVDHFGRCAVDGGPRRRRYTRRRSDRRAHRIRLARIPKHARSLVAVRAGQRLRAHHPFPADRADGDPGANSATPNAKWKTRRCEGNRACDFLSSGHHRQQGVKTMTSTLRGRPGWPLLGSVVALGMAAPASAAEELRIGFVAPITGL